MSPVTAIAANAQMRERVPQAGAGDELVRLRLWGPLTAATAQRVRNLIRGYARMGDIRLLVDLEAVPAIDASGVAALLDGLKVIEGHEGGAMVLRVSKAVRRALKESGTISIFRLWDE